jgi:hypothetical protein
MTRPRGREVVCGRDQREVARLKNHRLMALSLEAAGTGQNRAVERAPSFRTPDPPGSSSFDNFRIGGTGLKKANNLSKRVAQIRTHTNEKQTP